MRGLRPILLFIPLLFIASLSGIRAQNQTSNYGTEFRLTLLENYGSLDKVSFVVSLTALPDTVRISVGANSFPMAVYANRDTIISFTRFSTPSASQFGPNKGILVTTSHPSSLYVMNNVQNSSDITSVLPVHRIPGNPEYYINTYRGDESAGRSNSSLFSVIALDDSCLIHIMPSADSRYNLVKGNLYTRWLRKGEVYFEQAADSQSFAGTRIWNTNGCKRFSVFEGARCSYVDYSSSNCRGCDHLYNQTRPMQYQGKSFTTIPFSGMQGGYYFQVVASENNTSLMVDGVAAATLDRGEVFTYNQNANISLCIESDKPVSVVQLMKSGECNGHADNLGNPSLMGLVPDDQTGTRAGFSFPSTSNIAQNPSFPAEYYAGIAARPGTLRSVKINGVPVDTSKFVSTCHLSVASFKLNPANAYLITSDYGFLAYLYAIGKDESYATPVGGALENAITNIGVDANLNSTCDSFRLFRFHAKSDSLAIFNWSFGDGSTAQGDSVEKVYPKTGIYRLKVSAFYTNNTGCKTDTFEKIIQVRKRPYFDLGKDTQVCDGVFFQISPVTEPQLSFRWYDNNTSPLTVVTTPRTVWLTATDSNGCSFSDTMSVDFVNCDSNSLIVPNVFTPGKTQGDDINDLFEVRYTGFDLLRGYIYDRWGQLVYSFRHPEQEFWNGGRNNDVSVPCPSGTYYYMLELSSSVTGQVRKLNGVVQLIR